MIGRYVMGREGIFSGGGGISVGESGEGGVYGEGLLGIREGGVFYSDR